MENNQKKSDKLNSFSFGLGLLDYGNPVCFAINMILIGTNLKPQMNTVQGICYLVGVIFAMGFGLAIPTIKCLVGLGKIQFKLPLACVFFVNGGIFVIGATLLSVVKALSFKVELVLLLVLIAILVAIYAKTKKPNNSALFLGSFGYAMIYSALIVLTISAGHVVPIFCFAIALAENITLVTLAITKNLMNPKLHWVIESCHIASQLVLMLGILITFNII